MGTLTLDELKTEVRAHLSNRTDLDARLEIFLDLAQTRMVRAHMFEEFEITEDLTFPFASTDADATFIINANISKIWSIRVLKDALGNKLAGSNMLRYVPPKRWDERVTQPSFFARAQPSFYTRWGGPQGNIEIAPMPDQAYTGKWRGLKRPTTFIGAAGTATSDLWEKDDLLITLTTVIALDSLDMDDRAQKMWGRYRFMLAEATADDDTQPDGDIKPSFENMGRFIEPEYWSDPFIRGVTSGYYSW
jgi:hypothetical protein